MSASYRELLGIDGEAIEFEWTILPGFSSLQMLQKIQDDLRERNVDLEKITVRIFMSTFNDVDWTRKRWKLSNSENVKTYAKNFSQGHRTFLGPGDEEKWYGKAKYPPEGKWDSVASQVVQRFIATGHPVFKSISALSRGLLKKKYGRDTIHFTADASNTELLFRIIHSVNQLSFYGAVSNWCGQLGLTEDEKGQERTLQNIESVNKGIPKS